MFRDILAAIDSSPTSQRALGNAGDLATALNSRLTLISVVPGVSGGAYRSGIDVEDLKRKLEAETDRLLHDAVESLPEGLPATIVLKHGDPGQRILEQLEAGGHDLLVMGSRGRGRVATNLFGSVAGHVFFHTRVPMLVIQPEQEDG